MLRSFKTLAREWQNVLNDNNLHEANNLHLQNEKAFKLLGQPKWDFEKTVLKTISWYKNVINGEDAYKNCKMNIEEYFSI